MRKVRRRLDRFGGLAAHNFCLKTFIVYIYRVQSAIVDVPAVVSNQLPVDVKMTSSRNLTLPYPRVFILCISVKINKEM